MRTGAPRFRNGVTCDDCGDGYRRQFIVGEPHEICDECLDLAAETHA